MAREGMIVTGRSSRSAVPRSNSGAVSMMVVMCEKPAPRFQGAGSLDKTSNPTKSCGGS